MVVPVWLKTSAPVEAAAVPVPPIAPSVIVTVVLPALRAAAPVEVTLVLFELT